MMSKGKLKLRQHGETFHTLPHLQVSEENLEVLRLRILAPLEEPLEDLVQDGPDEVLQHGVLLAKALQEVPDELGRRRHCDGGTPAAAARHLDSGTPTAAAQRRQRLSGLAAAA